MPLNDVIFNKGQGGLGAPLPGQDFISAAVFYSSTYPSGLSSSKQVVKCFSVSDAENAGITSTDTNFEVFHYHISEFFRLQPQGILYAGIFPVPGSFYDFSEVTTLQVQYANGEVRQCFVYANGLTFDSSQCTTLQSVVNNLSASPVHMPLEIIYSANYVPLSGISSLPDLTTLSASSVSVCIGQDGAGQGAALFTAKGYSISCGGAELGAVALASVHEDIAWVKKFNISNGIECDTLAFATGELYSSIGTVLLNTLNTYHYNFLRKLVGIAGSYFNDSWTSVASTSDYGNIEHNRTINKAIRNVRANLLPELAAPLYLNSDGTLRATTVGYFTGLAENALLAMQNNGELSAQKVIIDPTQNVATTSELILTIQLVPVGVARTITVNIGFTTSISQ